jgi:hypothetical protein
MRNRPYFPVAASVVAAVALVAGCGQSEPSEADDGAAAPTAAATTQASAPADIPAAEPSSAQPVVAPPAVEPAAEATDHRVTYDWAAPSELVTVEHPATAPIPHLVAIYAGNHSDEEPPYQRLAFYFREGFPEYNLQYVPSVSDVGTGEAISLAGNAFLQVGFINAQAHDDAGESTISVAPDDSIGFQNLKSYGSAGDFEGHVTYGVGLQVAPNSDQVLLVRAGELTKSDGAGGTFYVVYVDIQAG